MPLIPPVSESKHHDCVGEKGCRGRVTVVEGTGLSVRLGGHEVVRLIVEGREERAGVLRPAVVILFSETPVPTAAVEPLSTHSETLYGGGYRGLSPTESRRGPQVRTFRFRPSSLK